MKTFVKYFLLATATTMLVACNSGGNNGGNNNPNENQIVYTLPNSGNAV